MASPAPNHATVRLSCAGAAPLPTLAALGLILPGGPPTSRSSSVVRRPSTHGPDGFESIVVEMDILTVGMLKLKRPAIEASMKKGHPYLLKYC